MNFRQLECFVAVVDEGSFTRAARRVGISQPSLSQHIRTLEADVEGLLLDRLPHGVSLTPAGRALLPEARIAVRALERGRQSARSALALELGELEIATVLSMAVGVLPRHIGVWHERHPNVSIRLHEFRHRTLLEDAVEQGVADFAIGPRAGPRGDGPRVTGGGGAVCVPLYPGVAERRK
jgi:DNA-binding transcriptional LysR family regulator